MPIDYVLILSAGLGTRMGEIGKNLPKPLWPILNKNLLHLQIDFCKKLGVKKIFVNTHFLHEAIKKYITDESFEVEILHEKILLGSGGAIHNLAKHPEVSYKGRVLLLNADLFFLISKEKLHEEAQKLNENRAVLFGMKAASTEKYNQLIIEENYLKNITKPNGKEDYVTYSGVGLINLDGLKKVDDYSNFFESVCDYKFENILVSVDESIEQWDFGTAKHYLDSCAKIFEKENSIFKQLLVNFGIDFKLSEKFYSKELNSVNLDLKGIFYEKSLVKGDLIQKIE